MMGFVYGIILILAILIGSSILLFTLTTGGLTTSRKWRPVVALVVIIGFFYLSHVLLNSMMPGLSPIVIWIGLVIGGLVLFITITGSLEKAVKGVGKIPLIPLLTLVVVGWVLVPPALGLYNWLSQPVVKMQTVEFRSTTFAKSVGQRQTISVGPLERWQLNTGVLSGAGQSPNGHFTCPSISLDLLQGRVFEERKLAMGRYEYTFTPAARQKLAGAGVTSVLVTFTKMIGKPGHLSPCENVL